MANIPIFGANSQTNGMPSRITSPVMPKKSLFLNPSTFDSRTQERLTEAETTKENFSRGISRQRQNRTIMQRNADTADEKREFDMKYDLEPYLQRAKVMTHSKVIVPRMASFNSP